MGYRLAIKNLRFPFVILDEVLVLLIVSLSVSIIKMVLAFCWKSVFKSEIVGDS